MKGGQRSDLREISLHIMDVVENGITAGAGCIHILIDEERIENRLKVVIKDNGKGMSPGMVARATDPFVLQEQQGGWDWGFPSLRKQRKDVTVIFLLNPNQEREL